MKMDILHFNKKDAVCKICGRKIVMIKVSGFKTVACDPGLVDVTPDENGLTFYRNFFDAGSIRGREVRIDYEGIKEPAWRPHKYTCIGDARKSGGKRT